MLSGSMPVFALATVPSPAYNAFPRGAVPKWLREQSAKLRCSGSNPLGASKQSLTRSAAFDHDRSGEVLCTSRL